MEIFWAARGLLFDLENIQALKGPQGTLFGRNSVGGALLLQTARPKDEFGGRVQVSYGNYNDREVDGAVNVPVVEQKLLTRIAFSGQVRDGLLSCRQSRCILAVSMRTTATTGLSAAR